MDINAMLSGVTIGAITFGGVLKGIALILIGLIIIRIVMKIVDRALDKAKNLSSLRVYIRSVVRVLRDLCGGVQRCFALGRSALIVDQRACGYSQGNVITFGVKERRDCRSWVDFMVGHFGEDVKIHLTGISMGAATVLMAAGYPLPKQVVGVLADCGYTSAREIIEKVIRVDLKLPVKLAYPFVKLAARLYGGFDLEELPPIEAVKNCTVPVIFYHGEADGFVPCDMSVRNFEACRAPRKKLVTIPGADHGLAYPVDKQLYLQTLGDFFEE